MRVMYTKPKLKDLSQGSRIAFLRQFRLMTQDDVSDKLGLTGECKRRTITRYEKGDRNLALTQIRIKRAKDMVIKTDFFSFKFARYLYILLYFLCIVIKYLTF